ncbi:MAG: phospholipase D family protein [Candidatus Bathyarchaeia archaeon]
MARFLSGTKLYETIQQMSREAKEILWVCSLSVGFDAHEIFSQTILKNPPSDIRFIFRINDGSVKRGDVNPYEVEYFIEHFNNSIVKSQESLHSQIYIFDKSALLTSANLTKTDFESNVETGVLLDGPEVDEVKSFFTTTLWEKAKPIKDLKNYKKIWNIPKKNESNRNIKKTKTLTQIKKWTDDYISTWYFALPEHISKKTDRKIKKEANWPNKLAVMPDIGPNSFKQLKLGDLAFIANLTKRQRKIPVEFAQIFDKSKVETDQGDMHFAYETRKTFLVDRNRFYEMLQNATIGLKNSEILLNEYQLTQIGKTLSPKKPIRTI